MDRMELLAKLRSELKHKLAKQHNIGSEVCMCVKFWYAHQALITLNTEMQTAYVCMHVNVCVMCMYIRIVCVCVLQKFTCDS